MYTEILDFLLRTARETAVIQLSYFRGNNLGVTTKGMDSDVVTRADKESETFITEAILRQYPTHKILGEEGGYKGNPNSEYLWVIDPLDGTTNYSQGLPIFCISIALQDKGETIAGVVLAPYLNELFWATKGGGAYLQCGNGTPKKLCVSQKQTLPISVIGTGFPYDKHLNPDNNGENVVNMLPHVRDLRRMGAAAYDLCCVACGQLDGYWELNLHAWDVCAANLIVEEAGGIILPFREDRGISQVAGNPTLVTEIRKHIR